MSKFGATVATEQPKVPAPGPFRTVTITVHAGSWDSIEGSAQQADTMRIGPGCEL
jgi:hypothetical protein